MEKQGENQDGRKKVVVVGGGFAGINAVQTLAQSGLSVDITLVTNKPYFQYYPSLYRLVVGATKNQVSLAIKDILPKGVTLVIDSYAGIDPQVKTIQLTSGASLGYDYAVLAFGSEPNYFGIAGLQEHARDFLSVDRALSLHQYFSELVTSAKGLPEADVRTKLHILVVGAGPSGVEMAAALRLYLAKLARKTGISPSWLTVDLLDGSPRVLSALPADGSALVEKRLKKIGVNFYGNYGVKSYDGTTVMVADKSSGQEVAKEIKALTVIWTAGTKISGAFATIPDAVMTERHRVAVSPTLTLPNNDSIYIAGDGSATQYSGLAQTAADQGSYIGKAIAQRIRGQNVAPYDQQPGIFVIPVGKFWAILNYKKFVTSGYPAYLIRIMADVRYFWSISSFSQVLKMLRRD